MGGNYEEVNSEIEKAIVTYMTSFPMTTKQSAQTRGVSPIATPASPPSCTDQKEEELAKMDSSPHITSDSESM